MFGSSDKINFNKHLSRRDKELIKTAFAGAVDAVADNTAYTGEGRELFDQTLKAMFGPGKVPPADTARFIVEEYAELWNQIMNIRRDMVLNACYVDPVYLIIDKNELAKNGETIEKHMNKVDSRTMIFDSRLDKLKDCKHGAYVIAADTNRFYDVAPVSILLSLATLAAEKIALSPDYILDKVKPLYEKQNPVLFYLRKGGYNILDFDPEIQLFPTMTDVRHAKLRMLAQR